MTFTSIGSFWYNGPHIGHDGEPTVVVVLTDAPVSSPHASRFLNGLLKGEKGLGEITDITVYEGKLALTMDSVVATEEQAKKLTNSFLLRLQSAIADFDELDVRMWHDAATSQAKDINRDFNANNTAAGGTIHTFDNA